MGKKSKPAAPPALGGGSNSFRGMLGNEPPVSTMPGSGSDLPAGGLAGSLGLSSPANNALKGGGGFGGSYGAPPMGGGGMFGSNMGMPSRNQAMAGAIANTPAPADNPWTAMAQAQPNASGQPAAQPDYSNMAAQMSAASQGPQAMPTQDYNPMQQAAPQAQAMPDFLAARMGGQQMPGQSPAAQAVQPDMQAAQAAQAAQAQQRGGQAPMDAQQIAALRAQYAR